MDILVDPDGASYHVPHYSAVNDPGRWNLGEVDLSEYGAQHTLIIFQGHNWPTHPSEWYVDEVEVEVCGEGWGGYKSFVPLVVKRGEPPPQPSPVSRLRSQGRGSGFLPLWIKARRRARHRRAEAGQAFRCAP